MDNSYLLVCTIFACAILAVIFIHTIGICKIEGTIEYVKNDWREVLPYRLRCNRYRGLSRPSYALLCVIYYFIKSFLILFFYFAFCFFKFYIKYVPFLLYYFIKFSLIIVGAVYYYLLFKWIVKGLSFLYGKAFNGENKVDTFTNRTQEIISCINSKAESARIWYQELWRHGLWWNYEDDLDENNWDDDIEDDFSMPITNILSVDDMDGTDFEFFCADLLRANGFSNIRITPGSGDQGIDLLAEKDDVKWGFQCKRWNQNTHIGNDVVLKTAGARNYYGCDIVAVLSTTTFTAQAETAAKQTRVLLWGPDKLNKLIEKMKAESSN